MFHEYQGKSKSLVMKTIKIKTYKLNTATDTNHFFILSKGYNAGKPLEKPCPNCFIVTADNGEHKHRLFWICYSLWKSGSYLPLLNGSVIPFLHIREASTQIEKALQIVGERPIEFAVKVEKLKVLIHTERLLEMQLKLIGLTKASIAAKLIKGVK
jgi:hypothetical protein